MARAWCDDCQWPQMAVLAVACAASRRKPLVGWAEIRGERAQLTVAIDAWWPVAMVRSRPRYGADAPARHAHHPWAAAARRHTTSGSSRSGRVSPDLLGPQQASHCSSPLYHAHHRAELREGGFGGVRRCLQRSRPPASGLQPLELAKGCMRALAQRETWNPPLPLLPHGEMQPRTTKRRMKCSPAMQRTRT